MANPFAVPARLTSTEAIKDEHDEIVGYTLTAALEGDADNPTVSLSVTDMHVPPYFDTDMENGTALRVTVERDA